MDIAPNFNTFSLDTLEKYIESHPEDTEKWVEFMKVFSNDTITTGRLTRQTHVTDELNQEIYNKNLELCNIQTETPIDNHIDGCMYCKKSWASTEDIPTTTLICGHKFHTICSSIDQYYNDVVRCIVEECDVRSSIYVRNIIASREKITERVGNILLDSYERRPDFRKDLKELKKNISTVNTKHGIVKNLLSDGRKELIHKHLYSINQIQRDMNETASLIRKSEQMANYKASVNAYRKKAGYIFRKYHVSFRELNHNRLLRVPWRLRWILERHRNTLNYYKLGVRIYPGTKMWRDTLDTND
jgi:hypothetical protein